MEAPESVTKLQQAVEGTMEELQKKHFIPLQKEVFLCSARCCDGASDMRRLQECTNRCAARIQTAEQAIYQRLGNFQERFQRCAVRCQDTAQEGLPRDAGEKDLAAAQRKLMGCMAACGSEYVKQVPKLRSDIEAVLKKV